MKLVHLSLNPPAATMDRLPLSLPFSASDLLWRYPLGAAAFPRPPTSTSAAVAAAAAAAASGGGQIVLGDLRAQLPNSLASNPRVWSRDDVSAFLRWCEREYDLPNFDMELFQMNGKALCLLTKGDLGERCPGAGDVLHNVLQLILRESNQMQRYMPTSPLTPTSRHYPLSPSQPHAPWALTFTHEFHNPLVQQGNSVTLSPAPSVDSQSGSPQHANPGSHQSDSDEDSFQEGRGASSSPPSTPGFTATPMQVPTTSATTNAQRDTRGEQIQVTPSHLHLAAAAAAAAAVNAANTAPPPSPGFVESPAGQASGFSVKREFFPSDHSPEPNTNGRLLWDFLQQLLNDPAQRYTNYIAWKNHETGVFKIVDPAGLAKLWGIQKNHLSMNYDKMSRALRYYYRVNILRKVQGERHCYQFLRNPSELKNIKNMSLLRQQMSPTRATAQQQQQQQQQQQHQAPQQQPMGHVVGVSIKSEIPDRVTPIAEESDSIEGDQQATDLTMEHATDLTMDQATDLSMEHPTDLRLAPVPVLGEKVHVKAESEND